MCDWGRECIADLAILGGFASSKFPVGIKALNERYHLAGEAWKIVMRGIGGRSVLRDSSAFHAEPQPVRSGAGRPEIRSPVFV